jgi:hypothetical protein
MTRLKAKNSSHRGSEEGMSSSVFAVSAFACLPKFLFSGSRGRLSRPFQDPWRRWLGLLYVLHFRLRDVLLETDASTTGRTLPSRIDQFDPGILQCRNQFHQRIDVPADNTVACFHALNGGHGKVRQICRLPLIYVQERTGGPELVGRNHEMAVSSQIRIKYMYTI